MNDKDKKKKKKHLLIGAITAWIATHVIIFGLALFILFAAIGGAWIVLFTGLLEQEECSCGYVDLETWYNKYGYQYANGEGAVASTGSTGIQSATTGTSGGSGAVAYNGIIDNAYWDEETSKRAITVYNLLTGTYGYSHEAACAVVGNVSREELVADLAKESNSCFIWGVKSGEYSDFVALANSLGVDPHTIEGQTKMIDSICQKFPKFLCDAQPCPFSYAPIPDNYKISYEQFKSLTDLELATDYFCVAIERCIGGSDASIINSNDKYQILDQRKDAAKKFSDYAKANMTGTITTSNSQSVSSNELGKLIDSENGVPLYDGYTFTTDAYEYWDVNYKQFWDGTVTGDFQGIADFSKPENYAFAGKNHITLDASYTGFSGDTKVEGLPVFDGRIELALPLRVSQNPNDQNFIKFLQDTKDTTKYTPRTNGDPPTLEDGKYGLHTAKGLYVDIVLDNGTVIPAIIGDSKGVHYGYYSPGHTFYDGTQADAYFQECYHPTSSNGKGAFWFGGLIELCRKTGSSRMTQLLSGHKIASFRTYNVKGNATSKVFEAGAGTKSSWGLTGGNAGQGKAVPGGQVSGGAYSSTTSGGTTGSTGVGGPIAVPIWQFCALSGNCQCGRKCHCHDQQLLAEGCTINGNDTVTLPDEFCKKHGLGTGSSSGTSGQSGTANPNVKAQILEETAGLPQGMYCDTTGKQLTGQEVWSLFESQNPTMAANYKQYIGTAPKISGPDKWRAANVPDVWKDKFGDNIGVIHYIQWQAETGGEGYDFEFLKYAGRGKDGYAGPDPKHPKDNSEGGQNQIFGQGCGFFGLSIITSTMLHRYITAPEIIMAGYLSPSLNPDSSAQLDIYNGYVLNYAGAPAILDTFRYNGKKLFSVKTSSTLSQSEVDSTLAAGGMVELSVGGGAWSNGGHFIVIRQKDGTSYYTVDSSNSVDKAAHSTGAPQIAHQWSDLQGQNKGQVIHVTPGESYNEYISYLKSKLSSQLSSVGMANSADTDAIIAMSENELVSNITGGKVSSRSEIDSMYYTNKDACKNLIMGRLTSITVPVWKWADSSHTSKVESKMTIDKINTFVAGFWTDYFTQLHSLPEQYVINTAGGYSFRTKNNNNSNPGLSSHAYGTTVDINANSYYMNSPANGGPSPQYVVNHRSWLETTGNAGHKGEPYLSETCTKDSDWFELTKKFHLNWGGMWTVGTPVDPMHFSMMGDGKRKWPCDDYSFGNNGWSGS